MSNRRLTVNLPASWLALLHEVARRHNLSAGEYVRRMIATDPDVLALIAEANIKGLPNIRRKWGGGMTAKQRAKIAKERTEPVELSPMRLFGRPKDEPVE